MITISTMTKEERTGWINVTMALKSHDDHDQHDDKGGENRLDIRIFLTMAIKRHDDQHDEGWREQVGCL